MNIFSNPSNNRIYITNGIPTVNPLPIGLDVTIDKTGFPGKITKYNAETNKYNLDVLGDSEGYAMDASSFRFNPELVDIKYNNDTNTVSISSKTKSIGGRKSVRKTKRKMNKKRKTKKSFFHVI